MAKKHILVLVEDRPSWHQIKSIEVEKEDIRLGASGLQN